MEGLTLRSYIFGGIVLVAGLAITLMPKPAPDKKDEPWMEQHLPIQFGDYTFMPGNPGAMQSYRMEQRTYDILQPFGIVCRRYASGRFVYDATVIASQSDDSFHDPRVCFSAQGWELGPMEEVEIPTKTRGTVRATMTTMTGKERNKVAAFVYKTDNGFYASTSEIKWAMLLESMKGGKKLNGVFYRFIPEYSGATKEQLARFIGEYLDAAAVTSQNYF